MTKVFVIILNWNRAKDTIDCLESIKKLKISGFTLHVVIVDNASKDNSVEQIQKLGIKGQRGKMDFKIIKNKKNLGYAAGNNVGIKFALDSGAHYVMVLNNDTLVDENLLVEFLNIAKEKKNFGILSPKIYFAPGFEFHKEKYKDSQRGKVIWYAGGEIDWKNLYGKNRGVDEVDRAQYDRTVDVDFATGSCMFLKAEVLRKVGLFDARYFMYYEDLELSLRIKKAGYRVIFVPSAVLWHKVAQSSRIGSDLNDYFITRNRLLFGMKYANTRTRLALVRESIKFIFKGRETQRKAVLDYYFKRLGSGSWK